MVKTSASKLQKKTEEEEIYPDDREAFEDTQ